MWGHVVRLATHDVLFNRCAETHLQRRRVAVSWLRNFDDTYENSPAWIFALCGVDKPSEFAAYVYNYTVKLRAQECRDNPCRRCCGCGGVGIPGSGPIHEKPKKPRGMTKSEEKQRDKAAWRKLDGSSQKKKDKKAKGRRRSKALSPDEAAALLALAEKE